MAVSALEKKVDANRKYLKSFETLVYMHLFRTVPENNLSHFWECL